MNAVRLVVVGTLLLVACQVTPGGTPMGTPIDADQARALVIEQDPLFVGIEPLDSELIGQAAWSEVTETDTGWEVVIRIGWGDCPAGCISEHRWTYAVTPARAVTLLEETGSPLPTDGGVQGTVLAGPTCPVVTDPPHPSCADRPVEGAELVISTADGVEVARVASDAEGRFALALPPGTYQLEPQPVDGLMGTAEPMSFTVEWGMLALDLVVSYDTGIR